MDAPEVFGLMMPERRTLLLKFLRELRERALIAKRSVHIRFHQTSKMHPDGTLLFAAELDRINRETAPKRLVRCSYPRDNVVEQVLQHLGLLEMMCRPGKATISADNVKYWKVNSDNQVDGEYTAPVIDEYQRRLSSTEASKLYNGLTEAMTNCKQHAYINGNARRPAFRGTKDPRWWMFSQLKDGKLFVAICDLGVGIPVSLLSGERWAVTQIQALLAELGLGAKDSHLIKAAMVVGKSRTKEEHRGKGLQELKAVIDAVGSGWLRILSNQGSYRYESGGVGEKLEDFRDSIFGTLIEWQIPVPDREAAS